MTWKEAIKISPEDTAVLRRGDYFYLKYPNGEVFYATAKDIKIKERCRHNPDGNWEPLGCRIN